MKRDRALMDLLRVMARLRGPQGCPWDRRQDHRTLRFHAVEEAYELMDAIEAGDDRELIEELGDLLLQVVFHCQLGRERGVFGFDQVCRCLVEKLIRRHPHVFGRSRVKSVAGVWAQWERIKGAEKKGTRHERPSALDGIPRHLPALMRAEKLCRKARRAGLMAGDAGGSMGPGRTRRQWAAELFDQVMAAQARGWSAEELLRAEALRREMQWRRQERAAGGGGPGPPGARKRNGGQRRENLYE